MEEFLSTLSFHTPIFPLDWNITKVLAIAVVAGVLLGIYCRLSLGAFLIWGLLVGFLGVLLLWLLVSVLALKWAIVVAGGIALLISVGFYLDEQTPVTGTELVDAAAMRNSHLSELFDRDPNAAASIAETLNLGLDESEPKWPGDSALAGIPKRVTRNIRFMLTFGFALLGILALFFYFEALLPVEDGIDLPTEDALAQFEKECGGMSGIVEERCILILTARLELRLAAVTDSAEDVVLEKNVEPNGNQLIVPIDAWRISMQASNQHWLKYRDSTCDTIKYLTYLGSGTGRFIARCRLRMTFEHVKRMESYGYGFPDYD